MKSLPERIGGRSSGELLDVADKDERLRSLVEDQATKDLVPLDGMGYAIGIPIFQHVVMGLMRELQ
jgi:hypothetical protein